MGCGIWRVLGLGLLLGLGFISAAEAPGRPFVRSFGSRDYEADSQNWAVVQDPRGLIYAANNQGVLEFDGVKWRLIRTRDGTTPRALAVDAVGRVFVGGQNEFGYLAPDAQGRLWHVPLDDRLPAGEREIGQVWSVQATPQGVFFVTPTRLILWDGAQLRTWKPAKTFFMGYGVSGRFLVLDTGRGLLEFQGGRLELVPGGALFADLRPRFLLPWQEGGRPLLLAGIRKEGLRLFDGGALRPLSAAVDRYLNANTLYSGILLADGSVAMATIQGGVLVAEAGTLRMRVLNRVDGLANGTAYCLMDDRRGGLWVGGSRGLDCVAWPPRLSRFGEAEGLIGVALAVAHHQGAHHIATERGLYRLSDGGGDPSTGRRSLKVVPGIQGQCWQMLDVGDSLLVTNFDGLYEVRGERARKLSGAPGHSTCLVQDQRDPDLIWVGSLSGVWRFRRQGPKAPWREAGRIEEISEEVQTLVQDADGSLWAGGDAPRVLRIWTEPEGIRVERFGPSDGLPPESWFFTTRVRGKARVYCPAGVFALDGKSRRFHRDPSLADLLGESSEPLFRLSEGPGGELWIGRGPRGTRLRQAKLGSDGRYRWDLGGEWAFAQSPIYAIQPGREDAVWFGGEEGLVLGLSTGSPPSAPMPGVQVRSVATEAGLVFGGALGNPLPGVRLPRSRGALRFEFALPGALHEGLPQFQVCLEGLDAGWSPWVAETYRDYTDLRPGAYRFKVRARRGEGGTVSEASFPFEVLRPWHLTGWAFAAYGLVLVLLAVGFHRVRMRMLLRRNLELERRIADAVEELRAREARLADQAAQLEEMNQELWTLNEQKNQFLGIVSHDLKTPLAGIVLAAESLKHLGDPALVLQAAEGIEREGHAMAELISRFLSLSALESGQIAVRLEPLHVKPLLVRLHGKHRPRAEAKGIPLELQLPPADLEVVADPLLLEEVLDNLLSNALKFSPRGSAVRLEAEDQGDRVRLAVVDHGPGLSDADMRKLFTRFARLAPRPTGGEKSLGLGLSIARRLIEEQGGRIWAESELGTGSRFVVELPGGSDQPSR